MRACYLNEQLSLVAVATVCQPLKESLDWQFTEPRFASKRRPLCRTLNLPSQGGTEWRYLALSCQCRTTEGISALSPPSRGPRVAAMVAAQLASANEGEGDGPRFDLSYFCWFLMGVGLLSLWNSLITATDYFASLYPGRHVERLFTVFYLLPNIASLAAVVRFGLPTHTRARIVQGYAGFLACALLVPLTDVAFIGSGGRGTTGTLALTLLSVAATGICDGVAQGSLLGLAGATSPRFMQAAVGWTAGAGLLVSALRVATKAALPATAAGLRASTMVYFAIAVVIQAACLACFLLVMPQLPAMKGQSQWEADRMGVASGSHSHHRLPLHEGGGAEDGGAEAGAVPAPHLTLARSRSPPPRLPRASGSLDAHASSHAHPWLAEGGHGASDGGGVDGGVYEGDEERLLSHASALSDTTTTAPLAGPSHGSGSDPRVAKAGQGMSVYAAVWPWAWSLLPIYWVTLAIFPGFLAEDVRSDAWGDWLPVLLIGFFNLADLIGKMLPAVIAVGSPTTALAASLLRALFLPLFWAAAATGAPAASLFVLTFLLGSSNGYLSSLALMKGPVCLSPANAERAGTLLVFFLLAGLTLGAFSGWLWLVKL